jgi:riboflavin kinase/FMN adenylyltransferase
MHVLRTYEELGQWGRGAEAVVLAIGYFDGVHRGHAHLFAQLRREAVAHRAQTLVITFSNSPREFHQPEERWRFLTTPVEKLLLLGRSGLDAALMLRYDRSVAQQSAALFLKGLQHFAPLRAVVAGYDSRIGSDMVQGREGYGELCRRLGLSLHFVEPFTLQGAEVKSSRVRALVEAGDVATAERLLGHPYFVLGPVVHGKGKGADRLDVPTANLVLPPDKLPPAVGIYAALAEVEGRFYPAATCVMTALHWHNTPLEIGISGVPPSLTPDQYVVETHLLDFSGDLYGSSLTLHFLERLRGWQDFADTAALQARIAEDIAQTREVCARHGMAVEYAHAG